jgi:hypothetical protein
LIVIATNIVQSNWDTAWLRQRHFTGGVPFFGYYAAAFAYLVTLPYRLRLLDYFDFFSRLDLDAPFRRDTLAAQGDFFPVHRMVVSRAFLFGCCVALDDLAVSANVMSMTWSFLDLLSNKCQTPFRSHSIVTGFLSSDQQAIPGIFQQFWLGYFSSPELKNFTKFWFAYPKGHRIHRWGDQQYYFRAHALFAINASETIITDKDLAGCSWYRGRRTGPMLCRPQSR